MAATPRSLLYGRNVNCGWAWSLMPSHFGPHSASKTPLRVVGRCFFYSLRGLQEL